MRRNRAWLIRVLLVTTGVMALAMILVSQRAKAQHVPVHMTTDWSNRHMIFSKPSSMTQTWRLQAEPRYLQQLTRRNAAPATPAN